MEKIKPCIYTTEDILEWIFSCNAENDRDLNIWFDFIKKVRPYVKLLLRDNSDFGTEKNKLLPIQKNYDLSINSITKDERDALLQLISLSSHIEKELDSRAILIFDITPEQAKYISEKYGIICHSFSESPRNCPLFLENRDVWCEQNEYYDGWDRLMRSEVLRPTNSLIFIDRYFLSCDSSLGRKFTEEYGIENLRYTLDRILPEQLAGDFHLLLVFDHSTLRYNEKIQNFTKVTFEINKMIAEKINRPYRIIVELLSIARNEYDAKGKMKKASNNNKTHNRRILSNYYIIRTEHSLKFQYNRINLYSQSLSLDWYASKGFIRNLDSDYMGRYIDSSLEDIRKMIYEFKGKHNVLFSQNGDINKPISEIVNRLVK